MTREDALIDAALTVQRWQRRGRHDRGGIALRIRRYVANALHCQPTWVAIQDEIVRRQLAAEAAKSLQLAALDMK